VRAYIVKVMICRRHKKWRRSAKAGPSHKYQLTLLPRRGYIIVPVLVLVLFGLVSIFLLMNEGCNE
jgi:hypothetical protein